MEARLEEGEADRLLDLDIPAFSEDSPLGQDEERLLNGELQDVW